jgi:multiple sugar transport system permease protein
MQAEISQLNRHTRRLTDRDGFWAFIMLLPNVAGFFVFTLFPVVVSFLLSFTSYDILTPPSFVGLANYQELFLFDKIVGQVVKNTLIYTAVVVPVGMFISLMLALALDKKIKFLRVFRAAFFMPVITSAVAVSLVWQWLYNPDFGLLNSLLRTMGISNPPAWLNSQVYALPAVMVVAIWKNLGYNMLLFLAGLQNISVTYYEAAALDGANGFQQFRHITWPLLSPTSFFVFVMTVISSFQVFDLVQLMTRGGPGRATSTLVHYIYQNAFKYFYMGYASALAYLLFAMVLIVTLLNMTLQRKVVY